jgi:hypothetical protein
MAAATITSTSYGLKVTGGTSATVLSDNSLIVKTVVFIPSTNNDDVIIWDNCHSIPTSPVNIRGGTATYSYTVHFGDRGIRFEPKSTVTLDSATDILHIHLV